MDPYDLPDELSMLQSQDMGKIGFMQDLLRGIKKTITVSNKDEPPKTTDIAHSADLNAVPLLKRTSLFLQDCAWDKAEEYCERVLDLDPENAEAYVYLLLAHMKVSTIEGLA